MASENVFEETFSEKCTNISKGQNGTTEETVIENHIDGGDQDSEGKIKMFQLPLARVRNIMRLDPDLLNASNEAVFIVTRASEDFIQSLARESYYHTTHLKKKTIQKRDVEIAIAAADSLMFLEGAMF